MSEQIKHRKHEGGGLMASIGQSLTGPKFIETDEVSLFQYYLLHGAKDLAVVRPSKGIPGQPGITATGPCKSYRCSG